MKQWNLCIIINLLFYTAIIQYMSQLLERQHFTAKMSPFWRYWHLCNENSAYATIASYAPSTRQGAIDLCRGSNNGTGSSLKICDPKTDVKEFYSILGIWWESYQIYYIDGLLNSWGMFSITSNIQHRLQQVPTRDPRIHAGMIKNGVDLIVF